MVPVPLSCDRWKLPAVYWPDSNRFAVLVPSVMVSVPLGAHHAAYHRAAGHGFGAAAVDDGADRHTPGRHDLGAADDRPESAVQPACQISPQ
jgi:hypothetical protein